MPLRKLPPQDSPEGQRVIERFWAKDLVALAQELGYANADSLRRQVARHYELRAGDQPTISGLSLIEQQVLGIVKAGAVSVGEISRQIDRSSETVIKVMDSLNEKHYEVTLDDVSRQVTIPQIPSKIFEPTEFKYFKKYYRIGLVSDTQICSKYQQMSLLYDAYKDFDDRQVDFILHAGDLGDGLNMYRGHHNEVFKHGAKEQKDYIAENYPTSKRGRRTYFVGGQHDFCWFKQNGYDILEAICEKRKDLVYRGFFDAQFDIKGLGIRLHHPGGGVAYARSYKLQKYIENLIGFVTSIPTARAPILLVSGHVHIPVHLPLYMGIDAMSMPCFQSQTPYLAEKGLMPVVGYAVAEIYLDKDNNLSSTKIEFIIQNAQIKQWDY